MQEIIEESQADFKNKGRRKVITRKWVPFLIIGIGLPLIILLILYSIILGNMDISASQVWDIIWANKTKDVASIIVHDVRIPRAISGVLVGMLLAVAGGIMQALTRNPLADPSIFGVSQGSTFAVAIGLAFFPSITSTGLALFSFVGAELVYCSYF